MSEPRSSPDRPAPRARPVAPLPFVGPGPDRASRLRTEADAAAARCAPGARVIAVGAGQSVLLEGASRLARLTVGAVPEDAELTLLGVDAVGGALFAYDAATDPARDGAFSGLRDAGLALEVGEGALAAHAVAMVGWHRGNRYCGSCGTPTEVQEAGHSRRCPGCGAHLFPRTDPAVIMLVTSGERCVLSRRPGAPQRRWSALAGFVEPGETPEAAVVREVHEEVGLRVGEVTYRGAQPWPFPSSLMLGFRAELAPGADDVLTVARAELTDARWFPRAVLRDALREGRIDLPSELSLGHRLIRTWVDGD